ncbi:CinA family protein [Mycoplasmoides alvi]|uniref:CinA family protein n=1 Tax=Mycoplasmoides alvi TaxID=78580 RepID=UPI00051B2BC9|nr:CinA family protein [Mycoplasmoides alvi]
MRDYKDFIIDKLIKNKYTLSTVESVTGGIIASTITSVPNASQIFKGSIIAYTPEIKKNLIGVKENTLRQYGEVSAEVAKEMAIGAIKKLNSDIAISVTGIAGPKTVENKQIGLYYFCIVIIDRAYEYEGIIDSAEVQKWLSSSYDNPHDVNESIIRSIYRKLMASKIIEELFKLLIKDNSK